jgi:D-3-phosphoglycerate dehydrogenase
MLKGRTCGIIGMGRIGQKVGALLAAFGCRVMYFDPYCAQVPDSRFIKVESLDTLLSESDIITLHTPAIEDQEPIIRRRTLMVCKKGVVIINTARGSLIDEESLLEALKERRVYAAGLDVFRSEPYSGALLACPQVVATPHVASNTVESRKEMEMEAVNNLIMAFGQGIA